MPSSRVIPLLLSSTLLLGASAGVAAVATTVAPTAASTPIADGAPGRSVAAAAPGAEQRSAAGGSAVGKPRTSKAASRADRSSAETSAPAPAPAPSTSESPAPSSGADGTAVEAPVETTASPGPSGGDGGLIWVGTGVGGHQEALTGTGVDLAKHSYAFFSSNVPQADMLTVSAGSTPWREVASAAPGSALHGQIVTWARTIKSRGSTVMLAYNHEPEANDRLTLGSAAEFIAAWRHVRTIFDQQGASNVEWTWQMTAHSFRINPTSEQYAAKWYPGDEWVDNVGADAYNWISCGASGTGQYNSMQQLGDPVLAFARAHGKAASFPEFAAHANPQRAQWLADAHDYFVANEDVLTAAFYFNRPPTNPKNADCLWGLTSAAEYGELRAMAQDTAHFRV